ncbi:MAG TPA: glutathione S-transferase family protein [Polyangiaceae bacterium]|nr:glutathione S-transferase family protein [Polyangiaceae bacterium]
MSLVFYYAPMSSATPVHWALEELGVPYEKRPLDIKAGDTKKPEFLRINPNAKVPVIVHDGTPVFESAAIQIYLGETFGVEKGLFPAAGPKRGEAMKWIVWCNVSLGDALGRYARNTFDWVPAEQRNAKAAEVAKADLDAALRVLDGALEGKQYLVDDRFTLADLHLVSWMEYLTMAKVDVAPYKSIAPWMARCADRPAHARAQ